MSRKFRTGVHAVVAAFVIAIGAFGPAVAAESAPMVVFLDHATLLRLNNAAERVVVGNPSIADVNVDSPKLISIFGKTAGETNLIILGAKDQTLLSRTIVVIDAPDHVVAVHVPGKDGPTSRVYSCTDEHCLRVRSPDNSAAAPAGNAQAPSPGGGGKSDGTSSSSNPAP
jgi:Flp pilus assembly secretin CpaC